MKDMIEDQFLQGMQLLAASTTIITAEHDGVRAGMAATAVCSLSAEPPTLLACLNRTARTFGPVVKSRRFAVNVVPDDLPDVVAAFSSKEDKEQQFTKAGTWTRSELGLPLLEEAVVSFECTVTTMTNAGTHTVFFAAVDAVHLNPDKSALIYASREFRKLVPLGA